MRIRRHTHTHKYDLCVALHAASSLHACTLTTFAHSHALRTCILPCSSHLHIEYFYVISLCYLHI
jgi:hypothetical protein